MIFDPMWFLFAVPGMLLGIWAQVKLSSAYSKYSRVGTASGLSGAEAAREILDRNGLANVPVQEVPGKLSDHYDPSKRALFLSPDVYRGSSIASVGIAAHEAGHALQHQAAYAMLKLRSALVPTVQIATYAWQGILILGFIMQGAILGKMVGLAIAIFAVLTVFQLITLPVEYDASRRAKEQLQRLGVARKPRV